MGPDSSLSQAHPDVACIHDAGCELPLPGLLTTLSRSAIVDYPFSLVLVRNPRACGDFWGFFVAGFKEVGKPAFMADSKHLVDL